MWKSTDNPYSSKTGTREAVAASKAFDRRQNVVLSEQGLDILFIKNYEDVKIPALAAYDVIIIDYQSEQRSLELLNAIRASVYEEVYLKPCFLLSYEKEVRNTELELADGQLKDQSIVPHFALIEQILSRTQEVMEVDSNFKGRKILLKLIHFLYSRDKPLEPVPTKNSHTGYSFPFLEANIKNFEYQEIFDLLEAGVEKGLLKPEFVDKLHLCSVCNGGFINYREVCPKCGTGKHVSQHTIHHFVCGYVGPESDFVDHNRMICPKCDRQLRHIGVDYDKPSLIMECENGHVFQDPVIETFCFSCNDKNSIESLKEYTVNAFNLTASGANVAVSGKAKTEKQNKELEGFVSLNVLKTLIKIEAERQALTKKSSVLTYVNLMMSPSTLKKHQSDFTGFSHEIARLLKEQLKATEIGTFINDDSFLIISPEEKIKSVSAHFDKISSRLLTLIRNNFDGNEQDNIFHESFELDGKDESDSVLEKINQRIKIF